MKRFIIYILMVLSFSIVTNAQNVQREGNTFTQVGIKKSGTPETKTSYTFKDSKGNAYTIYLSSSGKAYIKKISKKSGKEYKQYVPEIGKQINPDAYKDK